MEIEIKPAKYIAAISGGVDSMVLLDVLAKKLPKDKLVIAHYDHGIRQDSKEDRLLVEKTTKEHGLIFEYTAANLGTGISEELARNKRYYYLNSIKNKYNADAIITAHHEDDLIETAIINFSRGTGRRGIASISSTASIVRPFLGYSKSEITTYAKANNISWREDSTNQDTDYLRNHIRLNVVNNLTRVQRQELLKYILRAKDLNTEIDNILTNLLEIYSVNNKLDRLWYMSLDSSLATEVLAFWLRAKGIYEYDSSTLSRIEVALKVLAPGKKIDVFNFFSIHINKADLALEPNER